MKKLKRQHASETGSVNFTLSIMWSRFKDGGDTREAEAAFVLMQQEEERKGKGDAIFTE